MGNQPKTSSKFDTSPYIAVLDALKHVNTVDPIALEALERAKRRVPGLKRKLGAITTKDQFFADANEDLRADIRTAGALVKAKACALCDLSDALGQSPHGAEVSVVQALNDKALALSDAIAGSAAALAEIGLRESVDKAARATGDAIVDAALQAKALSKKAIDKSSELAGKGIKAGRKLVDDGLKAGSKLAKEALTGKK